MEKADSEILEDVDMLLSSEVNDLLRLAVYCKNHEALLEERFGEEFFIEEIEIEEEITS